MTYGFNEEKGQQEGDGSCFTWQADLSIILLMQQ